MSTKERDLRLQLSQLTLGYWKSQVLFTAEGLGVFRALQSGPCSAADLAEQLGTAPETLERLLNACVAVELVRRNGTSFENAPLAAAFLAEEGPKFMGNWVRFMANCYDSWGGLTDAIRTGEPVADPLGGIDSDDEFMRILTLGMHDSAMGHGREAVASLDLAGRRRLIDVGGGPGSYSILLAEKYPELEAVVLDLAPVLEVAKELIAKHGLSDRVSVRAADYHSDDLGTGFDVALLSNILHQENPQQSLAILKRAHAALDEGGQLVVQLSLLNANKDGPLWAVLQALQVAVFFRGGRTYTGEEVSEMVSAAGFSQPRVVKPSLLGSESLILATK